MQLEKLLSLKQDDLIQHLWQADQVIKELLINSNNLAEARERLFNYLNSLERHYFNIHSDKTFKELHIIEKNNAKECIRVFKNLIRTENEQITGFSALNSLFGLARDSIKLSEITDGFITEFIYLVNGINGRSGITDDKFILPDDSQKASLIRSEKLDQYSQMMYDHLKRHLPGYHPDMIKSRELTRGKIMRHFNIGLNEWTDYQWHLKHIFQSPDSIASVVHLEPDEMEGLEFAYQHHIPFQITPYYLSLFNASGRTRTDRVVRAQVLPSREYCQHILKNRNSGFDMDFMGERSTSPVAAITRRYPNIVILKPIDTCPQICVYCQRNWEIKPLKESKLSKKSVSKAIDWIRENNNISEVLITGGDPLLLPDNYLENLLHDLSGLKHIERIRIGTRVPVTLPFRITPQLIGNFRRYHEPGRREICFITHFEHSVEVSSEALEAVARIRDSGMSIYNQQVFTYYNSSRFETSALRKALKLAGIDPYYTFNTKGKEETLSFRVPIARIEQERKEEARFLPGIIRTDEPVFNVPKLGKSHLRSWQDHEMIMILQNGQRAYRFYPWESKVTLVDDYIYFDVPILNYLRRLQQDGENLDDYKSIWYYF